MDDLSEMPEYEGMYSADLSELSFKDLYLDMTNIGGSVYAPAVIDPDNNIYAVMPVPEEYLPELESIRNTINEKYQNSVIFSFDFGNMRLRGCCEVMMNDMPWVALRRIPIEIPKLDKLGFGNECVRLMSSWGIRSGGLILIGGSTAAGKTTTAFSLLKSYLMTYGRVGYTMENPVEFSLQGPVGAGGYCHQRPVHSDEDWDRAFQGALRWNPRYILVGEITSPFIAQKIIRHSTTQCLVIATIHAPSVFDTINAAIQLSASSELGSASRGYLAGGILAVVHQTLRKGKPILRVLDVPEQGREEIDPTGKILTIRQAIEKNSRADIDSKVLRYAEGKLIP
jgi:Tfp pilus assembly pilus retraction ATPase PilT